MRGVLRGASFVHLMWAAQQLRFFRIAYKYATRTPAVVLKRTIRGP